MPQAIAGAAQAFATWASGTAAAAGATTATFQAVYFAAYAAAYTAGTLAVSAGLGAIAKAALPDPEGAKITRKQPRPLRQIVIGAPSRFSGAYMHRETNRNYLGVVLALAEGRLDSISRVYLNDDIAEIGGDGWVVEGEDKRYGFERVKIDYRLGLATETHYTDMLERPPSLAVPLPTPLFSSTWPTTCRGDGIASLMMICNHGSREYFNRDFPNGEPIPSVVGQGVCYDWRDETQDREDESTWQPSANPVVWLVHLEWFLYGRNWPRSIEPYLDDLTIEANYCDESVANVGGSEPRYRFGGNFFANTEPDSVRTGILASMDGWLSTNGKGGLVLKSGRYEEPTFVITGEHIDGYTWRAFQTDEEACNELVVSYVSPQHDYTEVECDAWRDEAGIAATGRIRSENLQLTWVNHFTQARRLAKRKMSRLAAPRRGQIRTGIYGLNGLGQRYIRVQNPELSSMADVVVEVMNAEVDFGGEDRPPAVIFDVIQADENIDDWNPATEEGAGVGDPGRPAPLPPEVPTIVSAEVFFDDGGLPRLRVVATGPDREDLSWFIGARLIGADGFNEEAVTDLDPSTPVLLESGIVPQGELEVIVAYQTGGGEMVRMDAADAVSVTTTVVPLAPSDVSAEVVGANVEISWRNPASLNLSYLRVWRGSTTVFADATDISSALDHTGIGAPQTYSETTPAPGTWYYWVIAYTAEGVHNAAGAPFVLTIFEAAALAFLAELTTPADDTQAANYNNFFIAAAAPLAKLDGLWLRAAADSQAAGVNLANPTGAQITAHGSPTFIPFEGDAGDGVDDYLDTGLVANALTNMDGNDLSMGTWELTNVVSNSSIGLSSLGTLLRVIPFTGTVMGGRINAASGYTATVSTSVGLTAINRSASNAVQAYRDGSQVYSWSTASLGALPAYNIWLLRDGNGGAPSYANRHIAAAFVGGSLSSAEHATLYAALNDYLTAVGAV